MKQKIIKLLVGFYFELALMLGNTTLAIMSKNTIAALAWFCGALLIIRLERQKKTLKEALELLQEIYKNDEQNAEEN